jgi:5'-nucleotidase
MTEALHLLLTNDDGVTAPGLLALKTALAPLGKITVIAPSRNYSAAGHRKTMHKPLRIEPEPLADGTPAWACSGAPSDCVAVALLGFVKEKIDLVVSGINPHPNLGQDLTYSGTVTAAMEAVIAGIPGLAVSTDAGSPPDYAAAGRAAAEVVRAIARAGLPPGTLLNINAPHDYHGFRVTRQGKRVYHDELVERRDPRGKPYYWIGGEAPGGVAEEDTDFWAMSNGYVSITPLHLDLTNYAALPALEKWFAGG